LNCRTEHIDLADCNEHVLIFVVLPIASLGTESHPVTWLQIRLTCANPQQSKHLVCWFEGEFDWEKGNIHRL